MLVVGFCYFIYLLVDVRIHVSRTKKDQQEREKTFQQNLNEQSDVSLTNFLNLKIILNNSRTSQCPLQVLLKFTI